MDRQEKEQWIDKLLIFTNDVIEDIGRTINLVSFDFSENGEDTIKFIDKHEIEANELTLIARICISRKYLEYTSNSGELKDLSLTEYGQGRAVSATMEKDIPTETSSQINIGTLNADGNTQIGSHNTQNIEIIFKELIENINDANAPEEQKQEAKSRMKAFLEHPLVGTALGLGGNAIMTLLGLGA